MRTISFGAAELVTLYQKIATSGFALLAMTYRYIFLSIGTYLRSLRCGRVNDPPLQWWCGNLRFVHKFVAFCFQLVYWLFKTEKYLNNRKVAEAVSRLLSLRRSSFLPLFFPNPFCGSPAVARRRGFSMGVQGKTFSFVYKYFQREP